MGSWGGIDSAAIALHPRFRMPSLTPWDASEETARGMDEGSSYCSLHILILHLFLFTSF